MIKPHICLRVYYISKFGIQSYILQASLTLVRQEYTICSTEQWWCSGNYQEQINCKGLRQLSDHLKLLMYFTLNVYIHFIMILLIISSMLSFYIAWYNYATFTHTCTIVIYFGMQSCSSQTFITLLDKNTYNSMCFHCIAILVNNCTPHTLNVRHVNMLHRHSSVLHVCCLVLGN